MKLFQCFLKASEDGYNYTNDSGREDRDINKWTYGELNNGRDYEYKCGRAVETNTKKSHVVIFSKITKNIQIDIDAAIEEFKSLYEDCTTSDLQGLTEARAMQIIRQYNLKFEPKFNVLLVMEISDLILTGIYDYQNILIEGEKNHVK